MMGAKQLSLASDKRQREQGKEKEEKIGVGENKSVRERVGKVPGIHQKGEDAASNCLGCPFVGTRAMICLFLLDPDTQNIFLESR